MDAKDREYLEKAVKNYHKTLEESLSKAIRADEEGKEGYMRYLRIIGEVREYAYERKITIEEAAKELSG